MAHHSFHLSTESEESDSAVMNAKNEDTLQKSDLCLDLSCHTLSAFPQIKNVKSHLLQFLYLQGNNMDKLPSDFFYSFPFLRHLDLRQNQLKGIPASIAGHNSLEVLLLQDNKLTALPCELGQVARLRKLQFSGNPLSWPPETILASGLGTILSFLREAFMKQLRREDMDMIPKANDYECTKEENKVLLHNATILQKSEREESLAASTSSHTYHENNSDVKKQKQSIKKDTSGLIYLKGSSKHLRHQTNAAKSSAHMKDQKSPSLQPYISTGHAQAIMKGQPFPLGYKKRPGLSKTKICKTLFQQLWLNQLKCVLQSQDHVLQKQKTSEALRQWRQDAKALQKNSFQHNWTGLTFPYDLDSNYLKMVTRTDWQMFQNESLEIKGHSKPNNTSCVRAMGLQDKINQILQSFDEIKSSNLANLHSNNDDTEPSTRCKLLAEEMKRISNLQKAVRALRLSSE